MAQDLTHRLFIQDHSNSSLSQRLTDIKDQFKLLNSLTPSEFQAMVRAEPKKGALPHVDEFLEIMLKLVSPLLGVPFGVPLSLAQLF